MKRKLLPVDWWPKPSGITSSLLPAVSSAPIESTPPAPPLQTMVAIGEPGLGTQKIGAVTGKKTSPTQTTQPHKASTGKPLQPLKINGASKSSLVERLTPHFPNWRAFWERRDYPPDHFQQLKPHLSYLSHKHLRQVESAFTFAKQAHSGQTRKDGSPYIVHPMAACKILAGLKLDAATLMAALLHDVVEDCKIEPATLGEQFGSQVARIVDGVTKLGQIKTTDTSSQQAQNFQKMLLAMASDLRVILVKLADRLHNMRTLDAKSREAQRRIARETLDIYAPIANRVGLEAIFRELQDLSFAQLFPHRAKILAKALDNELIRRQSNLELLRDEAMTALKKLGIKAQITTRMKNVFSIYNKMRARHAPFSRIYDVGGLRVIVDSREDCYQSLGVLHGLYKPMPGRIKDFIALPKNNGYQSLHTTLVGPGGGPVEVQIRSTLMNGVAESGLAAHWLYKETKGQQAQLNQLEVRAHQWINSLLELQKTSANAAELLEHVKTDLFSDSVYVFTPKGGIVNLPRGSSALDFAYTIHSHIGHHAQSARINGEESALRTPLRNGDRIEIKTNPMPTVTVASLAYAKTARARSHIRHYLRHLELQQLQDLGEHWLRQTLLELTGFSDEEVAHLPIADLEKRLVGLGVCPAGQIGKVFANIALGVMSPMKLALMVLKKDLSSIHHTGSIDGANGLSAPQSIFSDKFLLHSSSMPWVSFPSCCYPIPGDRVVGIFRRDVGMVVHREECSKAPHDDGGARSPHRKSNLREAQIRTVPMAWAEKIDGLFVTRFTVLAHNQQGVLADISASIAEFGCNIVGIQMHTTQENLTPMSFDVLVDNRTTLGRLFKKLHALDSIKSVIRVWE